MEQTINPAMMPTSVSPAVLHGGQASTTSNAATQETKPELMHNNSSTSSINDGNHANGARQSPDSANGSTNGTFAFAAGSASAAGDFDGDENDPKRPRLRLSHACDRCRKRKIRCDTNQPCAPCSATKNECTFNTPSRRIPKPKLPGQAPSLPHRKSSSTHTTVRTSANLESRLSSLETLLRDVPPNVHNAFLNTLDAQLGSGGSTTSGSKLGVSNPLAGPQNFFDALKAAAGTSNIGFASQLNAVNDTDEVAKRMEGLSFFYEDEIGQAKWQGATSGFPLLELLTSVPQIDEEVELKSEIGGIPINPDGSPSTMADNFLSPLANPGGSSSALQTDLPPVAPGFRHPDSPEQRGRSRSRVRQPPKARFFPDRTPRPSQTLNPEASWKVITNVIPPDLMDTLVRCYLSTSHLLWPFLHVPSFLADYANPAKWGEPGFACFVVAVCTLSSRHVDDPRVRANPTDPSTAGKQYFELFKRLRDLPSADRPTLYSIQAAFLAAIFAFGLGNLSKAFALQAESVTLCLDGGLHRSVDDYDHFNVIEKETRKRTFWSIYSWDKQSAALFGRPPIIHLRDCDVTEPLIVDDEHLTTEGVNEQPPGTQSRMCAFVAAIRLHVVLEGVIDSAVTPSTFPSSPFLARAAATIARRTPQSESLREEEALLDEWSNILPQHWRYDAQTVESRDPIRITQAERLHCLEHLVRMIIYRHRFSGFVATPASTPMERERHLDLCRKAMQCALTIVADHVHISQRGMMTYYGVHVIHQLAQAGRTLVAVVLNCKNVEFRPLISPSVEGLRSCVGLLRRFSGRYLCGLRSADIIDEFCRICNIPIDSPRVPDGTGRASPAWLRPVRKRASPSPHHRVRRTSQSPASVNYPSPLSTSLDGFGNVIQHKRSATPTGLDSLLYPQDVFGLSGITGNGGSPIPGLGPLGSGMRNMSPHGMPSNQWSNGTDPLSNDFFSTLNAGNGSFNAGTGMTPFDQTESLDPYGVVLGANGTNGASSTAGGSNEQNNGQGLSAATILSLLQEGSFDYGSIFRDQAPLPMELDLDYAATARNSSVGSTGTRRASNQGDEFVNDFDFGTPVDPQQQQQQQM